MSNFYLTVNVMDRIMSTSIILLDQNFSANYVDIMVFEYSVLFAPPLPPPSQFEGMDDIVRGMSLNRRL